MFKHRIFTSIFLLACLSFTALAKKNTTYDQWTTENGLPQNTVRQIAQTPDGYLWASTFDGLVRFDGVRFTIFNSLNTKEITDNRFTRLFVKDDGTLCASMLNGSVVTYKDGKFKSFQVAKSTTTNSYVGFSKDENGRLLILIGGINKRSYYLNDGEIKLAPDEYQKPKSWKYVSKSGKVWTFTKDKIEENDNGKITNYSINSEIVLTPLNKDRKPPFEDKNGALWVGGKSSIHKLENGEIKSYYNLFQNQSESSELFPQLEDETGWIWFIRKKKKILKTDSVHRFKDGNIETIMDKGHALSGVSFDLFKDKEGFIWLSSQNGLRRFKTNLVQSYSTKQGLFGKETYTIFERKNGDILIGAVPYINLFRDGKFTDVSKEKTLRGVFYEDEKSNFWSSNNWALNVILANEKTIDLTHVSQRNSISVINGDKNGSIWVGTQNGLFKIRDFELVSKYTIEDGLPSNGISSILVSKNGALWLGTQKGISKFEDGKFTNFSTKNGLPENRIRTIYEDSEETIWIGTYGSGLSRYKDGKFFNFSTKDGLFHNGAFQIFEDDNENFWIGGNQGIYRVSKKELNLYAKGKLKRINSFGYGRADGMLNEEVNGGWQPAGIKASDGRLWFPTMDGVAVIDPKDIKPNLVLPTPLIEDVTIERKQAEFRNGLTVGVGKDDVEIHYTAPSFIKPKQIRFKYKLEEFNDEWIEAGTRRTAYYSYLPPGDYTFRLMVANSDGSWNKKETTLDIKVLAPFYKTNWFYLSVLLSILGIAFLLYRYRINQLEKRNVEQIAFSRKLISLQEAERKRIASGLHDGLSHHLIIIKNWTTIALQMIKDGVTTEDELEKISETSLVALKEVREITNDLRPHRIENLGLTDTVKSMIEQVESASGIKFEFEFDVIDHLLNKEDEVTLYRILQEYVNNIIKHSNAENAFISIKNRSDTIKIKISDDGKGFDLDKKKMSKTQSGFGLKGIEERLNILGGEQKVQTEKGKGMLVDIKIELK